MLDPGERWEHWKGGRYTILAQVTHTETSEILVIYSDDTGKMFARPIRMFFDVVDQGDGDLVSRFERVGYE